MNIDGHPVLLLATSDASYRDDVIKDFINHPELVIRHYVCSDNG